MLNQPLMRWECASGIAKGASDHAVAGAVLIASAYQPMGFAKLDPLMYAFSAGHLTGAGLNPARVLGPAVVFNTGWSVVRLFRPAAAGDMFAS